ncbi:hypothetical protein [Bradyrhizobium sp. BR 1432]|uniref:hypothetical protein n=1 Tax=Bradyrhizobium sp. BR 1432 TaxID=3447966 RepID=UPI003EE6140E
MQQHLTAAADHLAADPARLFSSLHLRPSELKYHQVVEMIGEISPTIVIIPDDIAISHWRMT